MLGRSRGWVCAQYCISRENLRHWVQWHNAHGRAGLEDAPRAGRPCKLTQTQRAALQARLSRPPEIGQDSVGRWRATDVQRLIRREYGVEYRSITSVCNLLHQLGQSWISGRPQPPQQAAEASRLLKKLPVQLQAIAAAHPGQTIELWCQDETRVGQKGRRTHGWVPKGSRPPVPLDTPYENAYIFGAFCPERDCAVGLILPHANTAMMQLHLDKISAQLPAQVHAAMITDGAGWHRSQALRIPSNITLIDIPPYIPQCNPAEKPWQYLKDNFLSHRLFVIYQDILPRNRLSCFADLHVIAEFFDSAQQALGGLVPAEAREI
jgi:transposase